MDHWPPTEIRPIGLGLDLDDALDFDGRLGGFQLAGAGRRTLSFVIDFIIVYVVPLWLATLISSKAISSCGNPADPYGYGSFYDQSASSSCFATKFPGTLLSDSNTLSLLLFVLFLGVNVGLFNGRTGQSIGKRIARTHLAMPVNMPGVGPCFVYLGTARSLGRFIAHALDIFTLGFGFLRGAWHPRRQTFADSAMGTVVIEGSITLRNGSGPKV